MKRPIEVTPICVVLILAAGIGFFTYDAARGWVLDFAAMVSLLIVVMVVIGFWCGGRLSHSLLAFFAAYAIIRPVLLVVIDPSWFDKTVMGIEAVLAVPCLCWLFTKRIDAFTKPPAETEEAAEG